MSSSAKRLVQTLRGRNNNNGGGGRGNSSRSDSRDSYDGGGGGCGGAAHSTSATRLFQYDSGHELDEISVIGSRSPGVTGDEPATPTTPYHSGSNATGGGNVGVGYGSRQTLYSIAGSVPATTTHGQHLPRITPSGIETTSNFFHDQDEEATATGTQPQRARSSFLQGLHQFARRALVGNTAQPPPHTITTSTVLAQRANVQQYALIIPSIPIVSAVPPHSAPLEARVCSGNQQNRTSGEYGNLIRAAELRVEAAKLELAHLQSLQASSERVPPETREQRDDQLSVQNPSRRSDHETPQGTSSSLPDKVIPKTNNKGKSLNVYDDYAYKSDGPPKLNGTQYFSCVKKHGRKCKISGRVIEPPCYGRMIKYLDGTMQFKGTHGCIPIPNLQRRREFHRALCEAARTEWGPLKEIYDRIVLKFADVAPFMMYEPNVRKNMYCHRRQVQRAWKCKVKNMHDLHDALQTEEGQKSLLLLEDINGESPRVEFETTTVWVKNKKGVKEPYIFFWNKKLLEKTKGGLILHIDATFGSRMKLKDLRQLLTVMIRSYDKAIPVIWVNMPTKTKKAYVAVFTEVARILGFKPKQIITDYEEGEQAALRIVFGPEVDLTSCFFHWGQAIWKNGLRYKVAYPWMSKKDPAKFEVIRKIMALPLLPEDDIIPTYEKIKEEALDNFGDFFKAWLEEYIEAYWLKKRGTANITVYNQLIRTNNDEESYHRDLNSRFRHMRPGVKNFWWVMLHFVQLQLSVVDGLKEGFSRLQKNQISLFNDELLKENWEKLNKTMSPEHFITICANEMKRFLQVRDEVEEGDGEDSGEDEDDGVDVENEDDENAEDTEEHDTVEFIDGIPLSDKDLAALIQTSDEAVILGDTADLPLPTGNREGNREASAPTTAKQGKNLRDTMDPERRLDDDQGPITASSIGKDVSKQKKVQKKAVPMGSSGRKASGKSRTSVSLDDSEGSKQEDVPIGSSSRSKRTPKPKSFDDYIIPTKKQKKTELPK